MMSIGDHVKRGVRLLAGTALLLAATTGSAPAEEDGASGAVRSGIDTAADSTRRGVTRAGEAVGRALDTAISTTGHGVSRALESTGNGIQRAGRAISGEPAPATEPAADLAADPAPAAPKQPIHEETLD
ncbi:MAG: hypothetical protein FJ148_04575 [Deltaproteobacteria bacterium]|nr:hypothetical protein [Deltaproteobacteria bacterium]